MVTAITAIRVPNSISYSLGTEISCDVVIFKTLSNEIKGCEGKGSSAFSLNVPYFFNCSIFFISLSFKTIKPGF